MNFDAHNPQVVSNSSIVEFPAASASNSRSPVVGGVETNKLETCLDGGVTSSGLNVMVAKVERWDVGKKGRFNLLARKEALEELSVQEMLELENLTQLRRQANHPRSADEILWQRKQQRLTRSLVVALKEYVEFHESPSNT